MSKDNEIPKDINYDFDDSKSNFPTKEEADKLVEDHCEPLKKEDLIKKANRQVESELLKNPIVSSRENYPDSESNEGIILIGADIQKNGVTYSERKNNFRVEAKFKCVDTFSPTIFKIQKQFLEKELDRELTDFEAQQILAFRAQKSAKSNFFFRQFSDNEINSSEYIELSNNKRLTGYKWKKSDERHELIDREAYQKLYLAAVQGSEAGKQLKEALGKLKNTDYPSRNNFKKRKSSLKNLIKKVVKWWRN